MYKIIPIAQMKRDTKLMARRGKDMGKLANVLDLLASGNPLPAKYCDHALLGGKYKGCRECHIEGDWLLVYKKVDNALVIFTTRTGTHSDLF